MLENQFIDAICITGAAFSPPPQPPVLPLSFRKIDAEGQSWYIGGVEPGQGVLVEVNTLVRYIDHANVE